MLSLLLKGLHLGSAPAAALSGDLQPPRPTGSTGAKGRAKVKRSGYCVAGHHDIIELHCSINTLIMQEHAGHKPAYLYEVFTYTLCVFVSQSVGVCINVERRE